MKDLQELISELKKTNSSKEKMEILKKYPQCKKMLGYIYSPFKKFYVTSDNILKLSYLGTTNKDYSSIIELMEDLSSRKVTGHSAIVACNTFIQANLEYRDIILDALDKNLKVRIDTKLINKVFPNCVPTFNVALAEKYSDFKDKIALSTEKWYGSRKVDGCRCIAIIGETVQLLSRQGIEFETLNVLKAELEQQDQLRGYVLDGEICLMTEGVENFQGVMKEIRRKNHTIENPRYLVFDIIPYNDFINQSSKALLSDRLNLLKKLIKPTDYIDILEQTLLTQEKFQELQDVSSKNGWEGLIIRKNTGYKGKRSSDILKVKSFFDDEYVVQSIESGDFRVISQETGLEETIQTLTRINILHKGFIVGVGSGFTLEERKEFFENPDKIVGKTITVQYFEETQNQDGGISLRFPTVTAIHGETRTV